MDTYFIMYQWSKTSIL